MKLLELKKIETKDAGTAATTVVEVFEMNIEEFLAGLGSDDGE